MYTHVLDEIPAPECPPALTAESTSGEQEAHRKAQLAYSVWVSSGASTHLAFGCILSPAEQVHFRQVATTKECLDAIVARYSTPFSATLGCLVMPFLFPYLSAFSTFADRITHLRSLDTSFCVACTAEDLAKHAPPMYLTMHLLTTRLPDRLPPATEALLAMHHMRRSIDIFETSLTNIKTLPPLMW
ncbi:unnamed protein product [Closterium sp. NIES-54]